MIYSWQASVQCGSTAAVFHSERKRAQSIYAFFSLPVGTTAKRYPLGFVGRRKRSSFQRNLLGTLFKTTTLSAFWFALECARCGNFENEMYVPLTSFNDSCWCKKNAVAVALFEMKIIKITRRSFTVFIYLLAESNSTALRLLFLNG